MFPRVLFLALLFCLMLCVMPVGARVPLGAGENTNLTTAFSIDDPAKTYVIYGILENAGDAAYFRCSLKAGDRLDLSLMNAGSQSPVPAMVILSPGTTGTHTNVSPGIEVPAGYDALLVTGHAPTTADYEPFTPAPIYEVASYSAQARTPGIYYVVIVSKENETYYSLASGYKEEFSPSEWVLVPVSTISTHLWEDQPLLSILAPFLAVVILGIIVTARREQRKEARAGLVFWLATLAGMLYLGGAALTFVQMFRVIQVTGIQPAVAITLIFAAVPAVLGIIALRLVRRPVPYSRRDRISLLFIGGLGLVFWAGLIIGPVCAMIAALVPDRIRGAP
ncbi:MAG: hypothetical protein ABSE13_10145 [Methanoregula sp.]